MFGLSQNHIDQICEKMAVFKEIEEVLIFGSRAMGNYKKGSDNDLALKGKGVTTSTANKLKLELSEKTTMPYYFDVIAYARSKNQALINHIDKYGIKIHEFFETNTSKVG
jgi:predicted nucleotidyltransferase